MRTLALLVLLPIQALASVTVIHNVHGYSIGPDGLETFSTIAFEGSRIVAVGDDALPERFDDARYIDGGGRTLLPGLIDAHGHVSSLGRLADNVDLAGTRSLADATARVAAYAGSHPDHGWILGRGWNQVLWEKPVFPSRHDLDALDDERPIWLGRIDGHAGWANTAALAKAGIDRETTDPPGGRILRDGNGEPTGVLIDAAMDLVERAVPARGRAEIRADIVRALELLAAEGVTGVHDAGISLVEAEVYRELARESALPIRVYAMLGGAGETLDGFGEPMPWDAAGFLSIASVKLYADGALGSRGAALDADYSDEPGHRGLLFADTAAIAGDIRKANDRGFQANVHAIGDAANRVVLEAFDLVQQGRPSPLRNRIEHAQIVALDDIGRFRQLGVIASMQPTHATSDKNMAEDRVGPRRILGGYAWRRMLDAGVVIAAGSDFPVEPSNPMFGLHAAVTRQDRDGEPPGGWYTHEALDRVEALRAFTVDAAFAAHQESETGRLAPGMRADFILVGDDYFTMPAGRIWKLEVSETWVDGRRVYRATD